MARARKPKHKVSRRFGIDIYGTGGASLQRRLATPPGADRRNARRKPSEYSRQLVEKQKVKAIYGLLERQFRRYVDEASRGNGPAGEALLALLERRLDNVVYRLGYARSRPMARQLVLHGHVSVDGRKVNIPSFLVRPGQQVALSSTASQIPTVIEEVESHRPLPRWLERADFTGRIVGAPERQDVDMPIDEQLVIAFYSRR